MPKSPYTLKNFDGDLDGSFETQLFKDGILVAYVECRDAGAPLSYIYRLVSEKEETTAYAESHLDTTGPEVVDHFIHRLGIIADLNKLRNVPFLLDDDDPFRTGDNPEAWGKYKQVKKYGYPQYWALVQGVAERYADRNPRVWDPDVDEFVPVAELMKQRPAELQGAAR